MDKQIERTILGIRNYIAREIRENSFTEQQRKLLETAADMLSQSYWEQKRGGNNGTPKARSGEGQVFSMRGDRGSYRRREQEPGVSTT